MLQAAALVLAVAAAQEAVPVRLPYLQTVERYGPGTEEYAVLALRQLELDNASQAFDELDRACVKEGARSCAPRDVLRAGFDVRYRILLGWSRLYPRVVAIHIEALVASNPVTERDAMSVHRNVILRLIARLDDLAGRGAAPAGVCRFRRGGRARRAGATGCPRATGRRRAAASAGRAAGCGPAAPRRPNRRRRSPRPARGR